MSARGALLGNAAVRSRNLVEFRAGKMTMAGNRVTADKRKGLVYVYQSDDALMHFCWRDRATGAVEDDLIIFPDECDFKPVPQCTTGRVYVLKFRASARKLFVWLQEPKSDKDEANAKRINEVLNNPPVPGARSDESDDENVFNLMQSMTRDDLMRLVAGIHQTGDLGSLLQTILPLRPSTPESDSEESSPGNPVLLSNLQAVLSHLQPVESKSDSVGSGSSAESEGSGSSQNQATVLALMSQVQNFFASAGAPSGSGSDQAVDSSSALGKESLDNSQSADSDQRPVPTPCSNPPSAQPQKGTRRGVDNSDDSEQPPNKRKKTDGGKDDDGEDEDEDEDL